MSRRRLLTVLPLALGLALLALSISPGPRAATAAGLVLTSDVAYDIRPDEGPVHVSWQVLVDNQDPQTVQQQSGTIFFYDSLSLPVLRGADNLTARAGGASLPVSLATGDGPIAGADVSFDRRLFFGDTYSFTLDYDIPSARDDSLLVTRYYVSLPAISLGQESTVSVTTPSDSAWEVNVEPGDCGAGPVFACQASSAEEVTLAALVEVSRPDAAVTVPLASPLDGVQINLGYEGLTSCDESACDIAVSPVTDDATALHELAHLWSDIYDKRWLAEGFANLVALKTAAILGPGIVRGSMEPREGNGLDLRLDEWGDVTSLIAASPDEEAVEQAGYDRSYRFLRLLEDTVGLEALQAVNAALAQGKGQADSQRFLDALEDASGQSLDAQIQTWVFPDSFAPLLAQRRQARDRLAALSETVAAEGLDASPPEAIRGLISGGQVGG